MNDIVIPYRHSYADELRYMLRSTKNIKHGNVWLIGDNARYKVNYIPYHQTTDIARNTLEIINLAVENDEISEDFIWWHDDQFLMKPLDTLPIHHRGYYKHIIAYYKSRRRQNYYTKRMEDTYRKLQSMGIRDPRCYELHIPFTINKTKWRNISKYITPELNKISMYANLSEVGGTKITDVKVRNKDSIPDGNFISTHDSSFNINGAGKLVKETFNVKCRYER